ncbi:MAG: Rrf2 family transcriptional regulator [Alphaproteobacteria bacterium]|nr:Rrf2 family transcriptional regulator [Alphaproteobacteria bacterium]MDX5368047.1 Rrf2 family transcriptional regulator [Alphaproteobacteria bacterium]MDX5462889.1 Rrf2 family transcriptional regulator [Alphaproteobacteria bacterium]
MRLSRKTLHAIEAVVDVAYNARPEPVQSKEITRRQGIPQRYLEQVMQQLVHAGILKGVRGPRGGYTLARERRRITVGEVVRVVQADEVEEAGGSESQLATAVIQPLVEEVEAEVMARLDGVTIEDLVARAEAARVPSEALRRSDFTI